MRATTSDDDIFRFQCTGSVSGDAARVATLRLRRGHGECSVRVGARLVRNARQRDRRGGIRGRVSVRADIVRHLKEDAECLATTMVDYYLHGNIAAIGIGLEAIRAQCPHFSQWLASLESWVAAA